MIIGVFGGTFDPPHTGHLNIALSALESKLVERVIFIPASSPPHKSRSDITDPSHRLKMTEIMTANYPQFSVSDIEIRRQGLSYTVLTLRELKKEFPDDEFRLIIGADMANIFGTWKNAEEIISLAPPLIAARPGYTFSDNFGDTEPSNLPRNYREILKSGIFPTTLKDISSTELRNAIQSKDARILKEYLDDDVLNYIISQNIY